jgi:hypothetical protein
VIGTSNKTKPGPTDWFDALPLGWLFFGAPAVTLLLVTAYWFGMLVWGFIQNSSAGLPAILFGFATMWLPVSVVEFVIASTAQIFVYPLLFFYGIVLFWWRGHAGLPFLLALTPLLGLLAWYGYDRVLPDYRFYTDERPPYVHGLTLERFLNAWAFEIAVVIGFWWPMRNRRLSEQANG